MTSSSESRELALGTALQFETTLRQRDVIGEWEPVKAGEEGGKLLWKNSRRRRWGNGHNVCNFDARAGGISEADDAGADIDLIRSGGGHNPESTTARYIRGTTGKSRTVSAMHVAHRAARERDTN